MKKEVKKKTWKLWTISVFLLTTSGIANADCGLCFIPYVGVDAQVRIMHFKKNFGSNILKKHAPQGNVFGGVMFNHYVGLETGYEFSKKQHTTRRDHPNDIVLGRTIPVAVIDPDLIETNASRASSKTEGWNLNLVGLLPILCVEDNIQLVGSVGMAHLKVRAKNAFTNTRIITTLDPFLELPIVDILTNQVNYKKRKTILRLASGMQFRIIDCIGFRALVSWENTSKLKAQAKDAITKRRVLGVAAPKNSFQYTLGLFLPF